jgi:hypothetical protein
MLMRKFLEMLFLAIMLTACSPSQSFRNSMSNSADYDRHRMSRLVMPMDGVGSQDTMIFEATISPTYPGDDPAAEEQRMAWLASWLEVRKLCPGGYEILDRRPFDTLDYNPAHHDLRYELRCKSVDPAA